MTEWSRAEASWASAVPVDALWNFVSRSFLLFMLPLVWRAVKSKSGRPLEREDLPGLPSKLRMHSVEKTIVNHWQDELKKPKPKLFNAIWRSSRSLILIGTFCSAAQGTLSAVGRPLVLRYLVLGVQRGMDTGEAIGLVVFFGLVAFLEGWVGVVGRQYLAEEFGTKYSQCMATLMMNKVGELDASAFQQELNGPVGPSNSNNKVDVESKPKLTAEDGRTNDDTTESDNDDEDKQQQDGNDAPTPAETPSDDIEVGIE